MVGAASVVRDLGYVFLYLAAIVVANLTVHWFGPSVTVVNAFVFIGFNLVARDRLHDMWGGEGLWWKMGLLILVGGVLSALGGAGRIAMASALAFAASEVTDAVTYHLLRGRMKLVQVNGSNVPSALVDSVVFPSLAFGFPFLVWVMFGQFAAKVLGGFVWSLVLPWLGMLEWGVNGSRCGRST